MTDVNKFVWAETYRPANVDDLIATEEVRKIVEGIIQKGDIPNMLLVGRSGIGKTTIARMLCESIGADYIIINASLKGNIDTLRNEILQFASTVSFKGGRKYVILDEADGLNPQHTQPALRNFMDTYVQNCGFILTANHLNKIIPALLDRVSVEHFNIKKADHPKLAITFLKRCEHILEAESIPYDREALGRYIIAHTPNFRSILNALQKYAVTHGKIDAGILAADSIVPLSSLIPHIKAGDYVEVRKWVSLNIDNDISDIFTGLYDTLTPIVTSDTAGDLVIILARYQYQAAFVVDQQINLAAALVEVMVNCQFK